MVKYRLFAVLVLHKVVAELLGDPAESGTLQMNSFNKGEDIS